MHERTLPVWSAEHLARPGVSRAHAALAAIFYLKEPNAGQRVNGHCSLKCAASQPSAAVERCIGDLFTTSLESLAKPRNS